MLSERRTPTPTTWQMIREISGRVVRPLRAQVLTANEASRSNAEIGAEYRTFAAVGTAPRKPRQRERSRLRRPLELVSADEATAPATTISDVVTLSSFPVGLPKRPLEPGRQPGASRVTRCADGRGGLRGRVACGSSLQLQMVSASVRSAPLLRRQRLRRRREADAQH